LCAPLVEWLKHAVRAYQEAKEQRSVLDFDDLLIRARDLVRDSETARTALKERFDYLLVDEYQDTDPLQTEIVFLLAEKAERFAAHWTDVELEHGKLFIVGDPKQSIYRFRRADMDLYKLVRDKIAETGVVLNIRVNFRSDARILVEINELFRPLIQPGPDTHYEPEYVDLAWPAQTRTDTGSGAPLVFLTAPADATRTFSAAEAAAFEAGLIADFIGREVAGGAIAFRDFAILFETRTGLPALETALRARAIPYQTFGGREFGQRQEIIALRTLLAAIDNPHDEISVVGALRLPLLGCSDPDLARHRAQARSFNYLSERSPVPAVEVCMTQLREWHTARADGTPSELVQRIYRDTVMVQLAALSPNGEQRVANLLKALELARAAENSGAVSLGAFLRILKRFEEAQSKFDDPVSAESGDDVVSLMTCHKAKGLEFPRVILYRLAQARRFRQGPIYQRQSGELELTLTSAVRTSGFERAFLFDRMRGMAESKRLLYVAMTRAKQALIVPAPLEAKQWSDEAWTLGAFLLERYPLSATGVPDTTGKEFKCWELPAPVLGLENEHLLPMFGSEPSRDLQSADAQAERDAWAAQLQRLRARLNAPAARERGRPTGETVADNEAALRVGSAVHRALEQLDYSDRQAAEFARNVLNTDPDLPAGEQARALQLVTTALHSPALAALRAGAIRLSREVPFACAEQDVVHEGKIDLIIEQQNTIAIVDYKTDSITAKDVPERIERHRAQLLSYCTVLRRLYPDKPVHAYLFFLEPEQLVPVADVAT
jgi:ATP-dependent helicase/nuclease subunit A